MQASCIEWLRRRKSRRLTAIGLSLLLLSLVGTPRCIAQTKAAIDSNVMTAVSAFEQLDPRHAMLLSQAAGVLIFPQVIKGGVALSNEFGEGVLQVQGKTVGYYSILSVSVGLTAGMESHSMIVMFMTQHALDAFKRSHGWSVGAENSIAVLSKGASGDYDSNTLKRPILGFVFGEEGLMADASVEGSKITRLKK